jgi:hypothetical protein
MATFDARFGALAAGNIPVAVFWVITPITLAQPEKSSSKVVLVLN